MSVLPLVLLFGVATAFFTGEHACGDSDTRMHIMKYCRNTLNKLDSLVPPNPSSAETMPHFHNFRHAHANADEYKEAQTEAHECAQCVLQGGTNCDDEHHECDGCDEDILSEETYISQNCLDHVENRQIAGIKRFRSHEVHLANTMSLLEMPEVMDSPAASPGISETVKLTAHSYNIPQLKGLTTAEVFDVMAAASPGVTSTTSTEDNTPDDTLTGDETVGNLYKGLREAAAAKADETTPKTQAGDAEQARPELSEDNLPIFVCALMDYSETMKVSCPRNHRITKVVYASFGTPSEGVHASLAVKRKQAEAVSTSEGVAATIKEIRTETKLEVGQGEELTLEEVDGKKPRKPVTTIDLGENTMSALGLKQMFTQRGSWVYSGDECYDTDFSTRGDCSAYNSIDVVEKQCMGASHCTLRATGDPKIFPLTFQKMTCDARLKLYVKLQCEEVQALKKASLQSQSSMELLDMDAYMADEVEEFHSTALLDFGDEDAMEFNEGAVSMMEEEEINVWNTNRRPIVRTQLDPPEEQAVSFVLNGTGVQAYKCDSSGKQDEDGDILIWRPYDEHAETSWMQFHDEKGNLVAKWTGADNTIVDHSDGSTLTLNKVPLGEVSDGSPTDVDRQIKKFNAPDVLVGTSQQSEEGRFSKVKFVQRYKTCGGMPPASGGVVWFNGKMWMRCSNTDAPAISVEMRAIYTFYGDEKYIPEGGGSGLIAIPIVLTLLTIIAMVAAVAYWKIKGAPRFITKRNLQSGLTEEQAQALDVGLLYDNDNASSNGSDRMRFPATDLEGDEMKIIDNNL